MNINEMRDIMNLLNSMYPGKMFPGMHNSKQKEMYEKVYMRQLGQFDFVDVENAIYRYNANTENSYPPTVAALISLAKNEKRIRLNRSGISTSRIVTSEENCFHQYKELMAKPNKTYEDIDTIRALKPYAVLFEGPGWQERYIRHFGKPREEFERYE